MPYSLLDGIPFYTKEEIDNEFSEGSVGEERARAEAAEAALQGGIDNLNDRIDNVSSNLDDVQNLAEETSTGLVGETSRATAAEQANASAITAERTRATAAEQANTDAIQSEVTRAAVAEGNLSNALIRETTRATAAETTLQSNIDSEQARAEGAESDLQDAIDAVDDKADANASNITTLQTEVGTNTTNIAGINAKIPAEASSQNQLADKAYVDAAVQTNTAAFRGSYATFTAVPIDYNDYPVDASGNKKPDENDYIYVLDPSDYDVQNPITGTWRFKYTGDWDTDGKNGWLPEYQVHSTILTPAQVAAINSGITSTKVTSYDSHVADTQNPHSVTKAQVGLGNCDNTSDANKPVSTAMQAALAGKQNVLTPGTGISIVNDVISAGMAQVQVIDTTGTTINVTNGSQIYKLVNDTAAAKTATIAVALDLTVITSDCLIVGDPNNTEKWTLTFTDKTGLATKTIDVAAGEYIRFIFNGAGFICEHTVPLTGIDENNVSFSYDMLVRD